MNIKLLIALLSVVFGSWAGAAVGASESAAPGLIVESFDSTQNVSGLVSETKLAREGKACGRWERMDKTKSIAIKKIPQDWSGYTAFSLWLYNAKALPGASFVMIVTSENKSSDGPDYYSYRFDLGRWTGWKQFVVPFAEMGQARQPRGWNQIDALRFTASGYGQTPNPEAVVCFDDFRLLKIPRVEGPRLTDEEMFTAINLDYPGLESLKVAVQKKDWAAAKTAWLEHLKARRYPRWTVDWRDRPAPKPKAPSGGSDGWDYYSCTIRFDWNGWKHFRLEKKNFGAARKPIGWNWIDYVSFNATGFNQKPNPEAVLYFDDIRLVGKQKTVVLGDFEQGVGEWDGLESSDEHAHGGRRSGKWQKMNVRTSARLREIPNDWTEFDALEFWCYAPKATGGTAKLILNSDQPREGAADLICRHIMQGHDFGPDIDWSADPHKYREWTYAINRFFHWRTLAAAYWNTGDERYAKEFCDQLLDWTRKNPVPLNASGNGSYTWRTIECGIRQSTTWPDSLHRVLGSASFTPEVAAVMTRSMVEHARHLMVWPTRAGNWLTMESNGLGTIGILLPEFKEAATWRDTALARQYAEIDNQVYPDGAQMELTTGYHQVSLKNFLGLAATAKLNDVPVPGDYHAKLRRMFEYNFWVQMPDGHTPALNDGGLHRVLSDMETAAELYGDGLFRWAASGGAQGTPPDHASHCFPYAGQMVMRSGWETDARYLLLDAGPFGLGHQHEDKLSIVVHAFGKQLIADPGNYAYDSSPWRKYTIDTPAHNTVMVDGLAQCRRKCDRATYVVQKPPESNLWRSGPKLDYAAGQYDEGYGADRDVRVVHRREVLFVKPGYWVVVDQFSGGSGRHRLESLWHFNADEGETDPASLAVRTIDPGPNCLVVAAAQPGLEVKIVKGQTEPTVQGFIAAQSWRPSWKDPKAKRPEHGKREVPTAIFTLEAALPARIVYAICPYPDQQRPEVKIKDLTTGDRPAKVQVTLPDGTIDLVSVQPQAEVTRQKPGDKAELWATLK